MKTYDQSPAAVARMTRHDLSNVDQEPPSPIEEFAFHGCVCGIGSFVGRPPWERHNDGDELLHILSGESNLTVLDPGGPTTRTVRAGELVIVPRGTWHNNDAPTGVTMLYLTPASGSDHSWDTPSA